MARMVASISKKQPTQAAARSRLFPYGIVDAIEASKKSSAAPLPPVKPAAPPQTTVATPIRKHAVWHYVKK